MDRAGVGEFDTEDWFYTRSHLQTRFLHRAAQLVPGLKPSLAEAIDTLPNDTFERLRVPIYSPDFDDPCYEVDHDNEVGEWFDKSLTRREALSTAIGPWRERWQLVDEWVEGHIFTGLVEVPLWSDDIRVGSAAERVDMAWFYFGLRNSTSPVYPPEEAEWDTEDLLSRAEPQPNDFIFSARWYPQLEYRSDIARGLKERFENQLNVYLDATEKQMKSAGLVRTPRKRPRRGGDWMQHLDWLIQAQLQERTHRDITAPGGSRALDGGCEGLRGTQAPPGRSLRSGAPPPGGRPRPPRAP